MDSKNGIIGECEEALTIEFNSFLVEYFTFLNEFQ